MSAHPHLGRIQFAAEKLSRAREALMLPHVHGEAADIVRAFQVCSSALELLKVIGLDDHEQSLFGTIEKLMDTAGIEGNGRDSETMLRAQRLTEQEKIELSRTVDELAHRLARRYWRLEWTSGLGSHLTHGY